MHDAYDIYIVEHVDAMKAENAELRRRLRDLVHENALLNERLSRHERAACYGDDLEWTNERGNR